MTDSQRSIRPLSVRSDPGHTRIQVVVGRRRAILSVGPADPHGTLHVGSRRN
jgi:hypothetical protein